VIRDAVLKIIDGKNPCADWFKTGKGNAHTIMSKVPIELGNPTSGPLPSEDASTPAGPAGAITVRPDERFYPDRYSKSGIPVGGVPDHDGNYSGGYEPGSYGARMIILLHELAHKVFDPSDFPNDGKIDARTDQSEINTQTVMKHCASAVNAGTY